MGSEQLVTMKLIDLCELIIDCPHSTPKWTDSGYIVLRNQNIRNGSLDLSSPSFTDENGYKSRIKRAEPRAGDLVLTREAPMGEVCLIPKGLKCCLGQRQVLLRPKKEVSGEYLFWALQSPFVQHQVSWNEGTGTTVSNIRIPVLKAFDIPRWFQYESMIASHLSAIRNKIDLNRQINQTLEQMAQTLFKSWFVDFDPVIDNALDVGFFEQDLAFSDELLHRVEVRKAVRESDNFKPLPENIRQLFPDAFEECAEPALGLGGWVPSGWELGNLSDVTNILSGFAFKSNEFQNSGFGVIKIKNIGNDKSVDICDIQRIDISLAEKAKRFSLKDGDLLMAMTGATVGKFGFLVTENQEPYYLNQRVAKFEAIDESTAYLYCILNRKITESYIVNTAQGSAQPNISAKDILAMPLITAPQSIRELFNDKVNDSFQKIIQMRKQNIILEHLRDTLLPKLISGELSLSDIKIDIPEETLI